MQPVQAVAVRHVAIVVSALREAESWYRDVFQMELIGREATLDDGEAYGLPPSKGWDDAEAAGIELSFVALRRDELILALLRGDAAPGQLHIVGLVMPEDEIAGVAARLPPGTDATREESRYVEFVDPFGIRWQVSDDRQFLTAGDITGRWLSV